MKSSHVAHESRQIQSYVSNDDQPLENPVAVSSSVCDRQPFRWEVRNMTDSSNDSAETPHSRAEASVQFTLRNLRERADQKIFWLLIGEWFLVLFGSFGLAVQSATLPVNSLSAVVIGAGLLSTLPLLMLLQMSGTWQARWTVVVTQGCLSTLLWCASGGRPEAFVHLYAWLVVLAWYRDVRYLFSVLGVAVGGNALTLAAGLLPGLDLAASGGWQLAWLIGLIAELGIIGSLVHGEVQRLRLRAGYDIDLEQAQSELTQGYVKSTRELVEECDRLRQEVATQVERRRTAETARSEAVRELLGLRRELGRQGTSLLKRLTERNASDLPAGWRAYWQTVHDDVKGLTGLLDEAPLMPSPDLPSEAAEVSSADRDDALLQRKPTALRALLVTRNTSQKMMATVALEAEGYSVDTVATGPAAYYSIMLNDYRLILVDVDLPGDEGYDTLEALRLLPADRIRETNCVFALTNELTPDRILRCTSIRVDGVFLKPLKVEALRQTVPIPSQDRSEESAKSSWQKSGAGMAL